VLPAVVADHLQSKRDISINLSGGLDSSLIFHEAVQAGHSVHAFSTRFEGADERSNRDADLAERLAHEYGQKFTPIHITKDSYLNYLIQSYTTIEEPNYNISVPIYAQTAHTEGIHGHGLRVVLSGDGGDELFGGYPHYKTVELFERIKRYLTPWGFNLYKKIRNGGNFDYREMGDVYSLLRTLGKTYLTSSENREDVRVYLKESVLPLQKGYAKKKGDVYTLMLYDRFLWLVGENFIRSDKLYMRESMEMRCPLSYTPLRTYFDIHIKNTHYVSPKESKVYLRQLYAGVLPDYIAKRKDKTGWRAPVAEWYDNTYKSHFIDILESVNDAAPQVDWESIITHVKNTDMWPGKHVHFYLSLALLIREYKLT
jgi:asparagine synthase (glutamine-hydrolysing)